MKRRQNHRRSVLIVALAFLLAGSLTPAPAQELALTTQSAQTATTTTQSDDLRAKPLHSQISRTATAGSTTSEVVLPNGLRVVFLEDHSFPVVSCQTWYRVGARNEMPGSTGVTHLLEHLLFGTVGSFHKGDIAATIARMGGQFNGYTSDDFTTFFETVPAARLDVALRIEAERMRRASFTEKDVQDEVSNIQLEFENALGDGGTVLGREVRAMLYLTHPYHNPTMGWRSDVDNLTVPQVKDYYDRFFWPDNCTLVIAGDMQPKAALPVVQHYFSPLPKSTHALLPPRITEPAQNGERRVSEKYPGKQDLVQVAYHAPALDDADAPAMVVLERLLNAPYSGRLKTKLVDGKICSRASACFEAKKDPGYFSIVGIGTTGAANAQQKMLDNIDSLVWQLRMQPVSDSELKRARNQAELAYYSEQEGPYRAGFHLGYFDALSTWHNAALWPDRLKAVSAADLQRVVKRYLNPDTRVVGFLTGNTQPHAAAPAKPTFSAPTTNKTPGRSPEPARLTGYKLDDRALAPRRETVFQYVIAQMESGGIAVSRDTLGKNNAPDNPVHRAIKDMPSALPNAVKDIPAAIGGAPSAIKELPRAVEAVPAVIKNIPSAVGGLPAAVKEIPSAVTSIPSAVKQIPAAVGGLPGAAVSAVKELPAAIGGLPRTAATTIKDLPGSAASTIKALPGAAVDTIKQLPGTIGALPGAAVDVLKSVPTALGNIAASTIAGGGRPANVAKAFGAQVSQRVLKNGINLLVYESHLTPIVQITGAVQAGSAYDPPSQPGLSALTAALLDQGTARRGRNQLQTLQEDAGLAPPQMLHFDSALDCIKFNTRCLSADAAQQLDLLAETLSSPAMSDADVDRARQDILNQLRQGDEPLQERAQRVLLRSLLSTSSPFAPQESAIIARSLPTLEAAALQKFLYEHVVPSAVTIVLAGDIDMDRASSLVEHSFSGWTSKGMHQRLKVHPNAKHVVRAAVPIKDHSKAVIGFGQLLPISRSTPEFANLLIVDAILSNNPVLSRLSRKIASQPALAGAINGTGVTTNTQLLSNEIAWSCTSAVDPNGVPLAMEAIQSELKALASDGITGDELLDAKRYLLGALPIDGLSTLSLCSQTVLDTAIHADEGESYSSEWNGVRSCTVDSVNRFIRSALKPDQATFVIVASPQAIRSAHPQVADQTPAQDTPHGPIDQNDAPAAKQE